MAARKPKAPAVTPFDVTHTLAAAKPSTCGAAHTILVAAYGEAVADQYASASCRRLPRHEVTELKGHKADKPRGLMSPAERKRLTVKAAKPKAAKVASKLVTVGGTKFRVFENGKVEPVVVTAEQAEAPVTSKFTRRSAKPKVRQLPMADSPRRVAAPAPRTKRARTMKPSSAPSAVLA